MQKWEKEEMSYWERKYSYRGAIFPPSYRIFERERFLFQQFKQHIRNKTLVEIGCLFPHEIIVVLNPSEYQYAYFGVDVARDALKAAKNYIPNETFLRCSATKLPFKNQSFDVLLSLGVLHHLSGGTENIRQLSRVLKRGGLFALSEAVERRTLSALSNLGRESYSPCESRLNPEKLVRACMESGKILHFYKNNSVVLGLFCQLIDFFPILQESKTYLRFITAIDQFIIKTLGRISSLFDAGTYFLIFKKN